jgi:hypothetical protein
VVEDSINVFSMHYGPSVRGRRIMKGAVDAVEAPTEQTSDELMADS